jgi:pimeloyl-ACP methyl ester carboxylesterase
MDMKQQLIIIPGWGGTSDTWKRFTDLAKDDFDVHFVDLPCSGSLPCPDSVWGVEQFADFVKEKISDLEKPILLGHSFGGQIATNLVANNPDMFSKLILSGAAVMRPDYPVKRFIFEAIAKTGKILFDIPGLGRLRPLAKKILYKAADAPDYGKTEGIKQEIFKKIIRQSQKDVLEKIVVPTLVVWGSKDSYVPLREGRVVASMIPDAELKIIDGGKHGLHLQQPENLLQIINEFSNR